MCVFCFLVPICIVIINALPHGIYKNKHTLHTHLERMLIEAELEVLFTAAEIHEIDSTEPPGLFIAACSMDRSPFTTLEVPLQQSACGAYHLLEYKHRQRPYGVRSTSRGPDPASNNKPEREPLDSRVFVAKSQGQVRLSLEGPGEGIPGASQGLRGVGSRRS